MQVLACLQLEKQLQKALFCSVSKLCMANINAVLLRSKTSAVQTRLVICDIFTNCFLFEVKILREVRLSENSSILLGITDARNIR